MSSLISQPAKRPNVYVELSWSIGKSFWLWSSLPSGNWLIIIGLKVSFKYCTGGKKMFFIGLQSLDSVDPPPHFNKTDYLIRSKSLPLQQLQDDYYILSFFPFFCQISKINILLYDWYYVRNWSMKMELNLFYIVIIMKCCLFKFRKTHLNYFTS